MTIVRALMSVALLATAGSLSARQADRPVERYSALPPESEPIPPRPSPPPPSPTGPLTIHTDRAVFERAAPDLVMEDWSGRIEEGVSFDVLASGGDGGAVALRQGAFGLETGAVGPDEFIDDSELTFADGTEALGIQLVCLSEAAVLEVEVFGAEGPLGSASALCAGPPGNFWGVISGQPIVRVVITGGDRAGELLAATWFERRDPPSGWLWAGLVAAASGVAVLLLLFLRRFRAG